MAEITSGNQPQKGKRKIHSTSIDLTPMVDLGFLLITFFVFTTSLNEAKAMKLVLPMDCDSCISKAPKTGSLTLIADENKIWYYQGFLNGDTYRPFLIRRPSPTGNPENLPWERYAIVLEFYEGKLMYGVRFDRIDWHHGDTGASAPWPNELATALSPDASSGSLGRNQWWPWKAYAGQETGNELYPAIVDTHSDLWEKLKPEVLRLAGALDTWFAIPPVN